MKSSRLCGTGSRQRDVVLLGHSWGTAIGLVYAARFPDKVAAYVGVSQVADMYEGERLSYKFARSEATRRGDRSAAQALARIGQAAAFRGSNAHVA